MSEPEKSAQEELKDAVWEYTQKTVVALVLFGGGILAAWFMWGDAGRLRQVAKELQDQVVDLKNQRETLNTRIAREARDKEVCIRDLKACKQTGGAAAAPAPTPPPEG